jgi:hypothetical protein
MSEQTAIVTRPERQDEQPMKAKEEEAEPWNFGTEEDDD